MNWRRVLFLFAAHAAEQLSREGQLGELARDLRRAAKSEFNIDGGPGLYAVWQREDGAWEFGTCWFDIDTALRELNERKFSSESRAELVFRIPLKITGRLHAERPDFLEEPCASTASRS